MVGSGEIPARVFSLDVETGQRTPVIELDSHDSAGVYGVENVAMTPDGRAFAYHYQQFLSDLYVVGGLQ